jgi:glycosyltransferase involved in cell wall biosynthesis
MTRPPARIAILSQGTSEYDSRAQRIARTCAAAGDTVTIYSRYLADLPSEQWQDGYRIVRLPLSDANVRQAAAAAGAGTQRGAGGAKAAMKSQAAPVPGPVTLTGRARRVAEATFRRVRRTTRRLRRNLSDRASVTLDAIPVTNRFRQFPIRAIHRAGWYERQVEPHDIWHGMWAGSLPALEAVRKRHGGHTLYDARDVFLRSRMFGSMPRWQRWILTWYERRWAHAADAVIQVSEPYAAMMQRDLGLDDVPVVRNCPDRWEPPTPRPDRIRQLLGIPATIRIVLYQGLVMSDRGIEQAMDAILDVPDAVLVIMGFGNQNGDQSSRDRYEAMAQRTPWQGKVLVIDPVPPAELLEWSASSDVMVMLYQPNTENHQYVTPQKLWEAMAAGVPVVASDLPGMAPIVRGTGCGVVCDPTSPAAVATAIRQLLDEGPDGLRARGDKGLQAAHDTYNWERQFAVLDEVYTRLLALP